MSFQKIQIVYKLTGGKAPPHPPFIIYLLLIEDTGSPHPPRITRRLVRLFCFLLRLEPRLFLLLAEKGFKKEKNLVNPIILYIKIFIIIQSQYYYQMILAVVSHQYWYYELVNLYQYLYLRWYYVNLLFQPEQLHHSYLTH